MNDPTCRECNQEPCTCAGHVMSAESEGKMPTESKTKAEALAKQTRALMYWHERALAAEKDFATERAARKRAEARIAELEAQRRGGQCQDGRGDPPNDCNWPLCGCDPKANEVLSALEESGWPTPQERAALAARLAEAERALHQFSECELNESNCASWAVANRRIRAIANKALEAIRSDAARKGADDGQ